MLCVRGATNSVFFPKSGALFKRQKFKRFLPNGLVRFAVVKVGLAVVHVPAKQLESETAALETTGQQAGG